MNDQFKVVEQAMKQGDIESTTIKLTIAGRDLYFKLGFYAGNPVYLDITFGRDAMFIRNHEVACPCGEVYPNPEANNLAAEVVENQRAKLEIIGRMATAMLQSGRWTLDDLISMWRATRFTPDGMCPQVPAVDPESGQVIPGSAAIVDSPLDAFARYAENHRAEWAESFAGRSAVDKT
jgi:hypothetical protein